MNPYYGTGWAGRTPWGHGPATYNPGHDNQQWQNGPPQYTPNQGYYGGQNQGYYNGQQGGVEMQPPPQAYRGGDNVYEPPVGPPPGKK